MKITMDKKYQTRNGLLVEILRDNVRHPDFPVVGIITYADGSQSQDRWMSNGKYDGGGENPLDLIPALTIFVGFIVISKDYFAWGQSICNTPEEAANEGLKEGDHIARVTWEN